MRYLWGVLMFAAACGGSAAGGGTTGPTPPTGESGEPGGAAGTAPTAGAPVSPELVCTRALALHDGGCPRFAEFGLTAEECREETRRGLEDRGAEAREAVTRFGRCLLDHGDCAEVVSCLDVAFADASGHDTESLRSCAEGGSQAVGYPKDQWDRRKGAGAARFSEVTSTVEAPIEVCTIPAEMQWLMNAKCDDGSSPFRNYDHAHASRVGNVGAGGRCNAIIDLYEVPCPEATYQVYIDAYVCPLPD